MLTPKRSTSYNNCSLLSADPSVQMVGSEVTNFFARALLIFPPMPYFLNARNWQFYPRGATPPLPGDKTPVPSDNKELQAGAYAKSMTRH